MGATHISESKGQHENTNILHSHRPPPPIRKLATVPSICCIYPGLTKTTQFENTAMAKSGLLSLSFASPPAKCSGEREQIPTTSKLSSSPQQQLFIPQQSESHSAKFRGQSELRESSMVYSENTLGLVGAE